MSSAGWCGLAQPVEIGGADARLGLCKILECKNVRAKNQNLTKDLTKPKARKSAGLR